MKLWQVFNRPESIETALHALVDSPSPSAIIAGGTDLLLDLRQKRASVHTLIDVTGIPELNKLSLGIDGLYVGAAVPVAQLAVSPIISTHSQALMDACQILGGLQVRNVATLGGNIAHSLPAADGTIALMCLDSTAEVANLSGYKHLALEELFLGPGKSALNHDDLLVGFHIPITKPGQGSAFRRIMRAQGIALPILNISVWLERSKERILQIRIACGPAGPVPHRLPQTEESLSGKPFSKKNIVIAKAILQREVVFRTSRYRATASYRENQAGILLEETLETAWRRAGSTLGADIE